MISLQYREVVYYPSRREWRAGRDQMTSSGEGGRWRDGLERREN